MHSSISPASSCERRPSARLSPTYCKLAAFALIGAVSTYGCVLAPAGLQEERDALEQAGQHYTPPLEQRFLPELPELPDWRALLERGFAANGELEARYFEWNAALDRVVIAAGYPDTNLAPSLGYMLSGAGMTAWDRTTVNVGFNPMNMLSLPNKVSKAGEIALEQAREAGRRFAQAKFAVQREVLDLWLDLSLLEERLRIQRDRAELARIGAESLAQRAALGAEQRDLLRAEIEWSQERVELANLHAQLRASRAALNALLARAPDAPLELGGALPPPRLLAADDAKLIERGVENNPELQALAFAVAASEGALELARLRYLPDFNPFFGFTGGVQQMLGVDVSLPTRLPQIRAGVAEARAMLRGASAELRQSHLDLHASFVAALYMLRFSEREVDFLLGEVEPTTERLAESTAQSYATGTASFVELLDAQRARLEVREALAEARIERERRVAELEQLAGLDIEMLATQPNDKRNESKDEHHE